MANNDKVKQKVCLVVIDGWGISEQQNGNAIANANTPVMDRLCSGNWQQLAAHGEHVGLPDGLMGNSEVGHLNIGAGRVIYQVILNEKIIIKIHQFF
jgi:2,3-bisphosphoglycerate-independent phosphoglycerate mutase